MNQGVDCHVAPQSRDHLVWITQLLSCLCPLTSALLVNMMTFNSQQYIVIMSLYCQSIFNAYIFFSTKYGFPLHTFKLYRIINALTYEYIGKAFR